MNHDHANPEAALKRAARYQSGIIAAETAARLAAEREAARVRSEQSRREAARVRAQQLAENGARLLALQTNEDPLTRHARAILTDALKEARISAVEWRDVRSDSVSGLFSANAISVRATDWRNWRDVDTKNNGVIRCFSEPGAGNTFSFVVFTTIAAQVSSTGVRVAAVPSSASDTAPGTEPAAIEVSFADPEWPGKLRDGLRKVAGVSPALKAG